MFVLCPYWGFIARKNSTISIKAFGKTFRLGECAEKEKAENVFSDTTIRFYVHFFVLSIAFIDVADLFADPACTCHCRMHFVCINVNKLVRTIERNTRNEEGMAEIKDKYIYDKLS